METTNSPFPSPFTWNYGQQPQMSTPQAVPPEEPKFDPEAYKNEKKALVDQYVRGNLTSEQFTNEYFRNVSNKIPPAVMMSMAQNYTNAINSGRAPQSQEQAAEAVATLAGAKTAGAADALKQLGPQAFIQQQIQQLQQNPNGVGAEADKVWLNSLLRTGSFDTAGAAYVDVYKTGLSKMIEGQNQLAVKYADEQIKKGQALEAINNIKINTTASLLKTRPQAVTQQQVGDWAGQIANANYMAKENPNAASVNLKQVIEQMRGAGYSENAIISSGAAEGLRLSPEQEKILAPILQYMKPELVARFRLNDGQMDEEITKDMERAQAKLAKRKATEQAQIAGAEANARLPAEKSLAEFRNSLEVGSAEQKAYANKMGAERADAAVNLPAQRQQLALATQTIKELRASVDKELVNTSTGFGYGIGQALSYIGGTESKTFHGLLDSLKSDVFLANVNKMRGLGALSNAEGAKVIDAIGKLDPGMSKSDFDREMTKIENSLTIMVRESEKTARVSSTSDIRSQADAIIGRK